MSSPQPPPAPTPALVDPLFAEMMNDEDTAVELDQAAAVLWDNYRLHGAMSGLPGERDRNILVATETDELFVLKIAGPNEPAIVTDLQLDVLRWLGRSQSDLSFPRLRATISGTDCVTFCDAANRPRIARLLSYVPGQPLRAPRYSRDQRIAAGEACGRLTLALAGFDHPAARRGLIWDVVGAAERIEPLTACLPTDEVKAAAAMLLTHFATEAAARIAALPHQVIHNDLNAGNLMTDPRNEALVTGVIDFGDVLWTATIADAAVGATSLLTTGCDLRQSLSDFLCGYSRQRKASAEELALFPCLVAMRLLLLLVVPAWHRSANPSNPHYQNFDPEFEVRSAWIRQLMTMGDGFSDD
jgi:hydroxylysine kinase